MEPSRLFQVISVVVALALAALLFSLRFCVDHTIAPKPPRPVVEIQDVRDMIDRNNALPQTWLTFLDKDADAAGLKAPLAADLRRAFPYQLDETKRNLTVGGSFQAAGLTISLAIRPVNNEPTAVLEVANDGRLAKAFRILASSNYSSNECSRSSSLFESRTAVPGGGKVARNECTARRDLALDIISVESMEVPELSALYISRVPAGVFGLDHRLARDHRALFGGAMCMVALSSAVRGAFENGKITWRDLVDFYARHRCDSYQFPLDYRAFTGEGEMELPAVAPQ